MVNEDLNDIQELEEGQLETSGSCDSIMVNDACCQRRCGPMQEVSSSCSSSDAENLVICVDIHQPQPKRWKPQKEPTEKSNETQCSLHDDRNTVCDENVVRDAEEEKS